MSGLNGSDGSSGVSELSIEEREDRILLVWGDNMVHLVPQQAIDVGETLVKYGYHAKTGRNPDVRKEMSKQIRQKLDTRVALVVKNLEDRNVKPMRIAQEVVDIVLREIL